MSDSLWPQGLYSPWNSPGQSTGVGSLSLLQAIFPTQGSNPGLPHCRQILYQLSHKGHTVVSQIVDCTGLGSSLLVLLSLCRQSILKEPLRVIWLKKYKAECVTLLLKILQLLPMFFRMKVLWLQVPTNLRFYLFSAHFSDFISYLDSSGQTHLDLMRLCICSVLWSSLLSLFLTSSDISSKVTFLVKPSVITLSSSNLPFHIPFPCFIIIS